MNIQLQSSLQQWPENCMVDTDYLLKEYFNGLESWRKEPVESKKHNYIYHISLSIHFNGQKLFTNATLMEHIVNTKDMLGPDVTDFRFAPATAPRKHREVDQGSQIPLNTGQQSKKMLENFGSLRALRAFYYISTA